MPIDQPAPVESLLPLQHVVEVAAAKPEDLSFAHEERPAPIVGVYRDSELRAVLVSIATIAFIASMLLALWINWQVFNLQADGDSVPTDGLLALWLPALGAAIGVGVMALLAYGFWMSRVVANLPALGLGYTRVGPTWAFFEALLPGYNFMAIPARLAEVNKKAGGHANMLPLIGLALALAIVPGGVLYILVRVTRVVGDHGDRLRVTGGGLFVMFVFQAVALLILLHVIWLAEGLVRAKAAKRDH